MADPKSTIPLEAFFDEKLGPNLHANTRELLHQAEVIWGVDVMTQRDFLVFGRDVFEGIVASGIPRRVAVLRIAVDIETDELEKLIALVRTVEGRDDYQGWGEEGKPLS